jgi:hypothetical protein
MKTPSPRKRSRSRGSAIVELALSLTFIVPVMLYAGYLSDALYDGLKAQEATAAAAWSFTGHLLHDYDAYNHESKYAAAGMVVRSEINKLYQGLDPWAQAALGQSLTELDGVSAKGTMLAGAVCTPETKTSIKDPSSPAQMVGLGSLPAMQTLSKDLHSGGLITCQAQVEVTNWLFGKATGQTTLLNKNDQMWPTNLLGSVELCGVGPAVNGSCQSTGQTFVMYTDDWGLAQDGNVNQDDDWTNYQDYKTAVNKHFANLGQLVYEQEAPLPYTSAIQSTEALASAGFCSNEVPIDPVPVLDSQYTPGSQPHNTYNLAEVQGTAFSQGSAPPDNYARDDASPANSYEGSIKQPSYTWPVRHLAAGPIADNAYLNMEQARANDYLGL